MPPDEGLDAEGRAHCDFANGLLRFFVGREAPRRAIRDYLAGEGGRPLAVVAAGGAGKSALMAKALEEAKGAHPERAVHLPLHRRDTVLLGRPQPAGQPVPGDLAPLRRRRGSPLRLHGAGGGAGEADGERHRRPAARPLPRRAGPALRGPRRPQPRLAAAAAARGCAGGGLHAEGGGHVRGRDAAPGRGGGARPDVAHRRATSCSASGWTTPIEGSRRSSGRRCWTPSRASARAVGPST